MGSQTNLIAGELLYTTAKSKDSSGRDQYIGLALPGTAKSSGGWQIKLITYDAAGFITDIQFAGGKADFTHTWDNRTTYTYS